MRSAINIGTAPPEYSEIAIISHGQHKNPQLEKLRLSSKLANGSNIKDHDLIRILPSFRIAYSRKRKHRLQEGVEVQVVP